MTAPLPSLSALTGPPPLPAFQTGGAGGVSMDDMPWHQKFSAELVVILIAAAGFTIAIAWSNAFSEALAALLPNTKESNSWARAGVFFLHALIITLFLLLLVHAMTGGDFKLLNSAILGSSPV